MLQDDDDEDLKRALAASLAEVARQQRSLLFFNHAVIASSCSPPQQSRSGCGVIEDDDDAVILLEGKPASQVKSAAPPQEPATKAESKPDPNKRGRKPVAGLKTHLLFALSVILGAYCRARQRHH